MTDRIFPFSLEGDLEEQIAKQPEWLEGLEYGRPRHGHPEGKIKFHIAAVLNNVERFYGDSPDRNRLRLITLVHDTFKFRVDPSTKTQQDAFRDKLPHQPPATGSHGKFVTPQAGKP